MINTTLLLDPETWDIGLDAKGNIATVQNPYSCAQDAATACALFQGENFYDVTIGIPYSTNVLGEHPGIGAIQTWLENEALRLPYIRQASAIIFTDDTNRTASGEINVVDTNGIKSTINL